MYVQQAQMRCNSFMCYVAPTISIEGLDELIDVKSPMIWRCHIEDTTFLVQHGKKSILELDDLVFIDFPEKHNETKATFFDLIDATFSLLNRA